MKRYLFFLLVALPILLILVPGVLVIYRSPISPNTLLEKQKKPPVITAPAKQLPIKVYRTESKQIESIPLEAYVEGVVAAEMPAEFELEALKAQAMAARTYIIRRLQAGKFDDVPKGAQVLDTVKHQAYLDDGQRKERWKEQYDWKSKRIHEAVEATAGVVLTYDNQPIDATFFSTSNGFTENANEYWTDPIPYLKSVASPWDSESPRFTEHTAIAVSEFERKLGVTLDAAAIQNSQKPSWYQVLERTTGNRVGRIRIGNKEFTGKEVRERLGLNSAAFTMKLERGQVDITTHGYGHGVGMSQWGANGMAKSGKNAEQIVKYFYKGISLQSYEKILTS